VELELFVSPKAGHVRATKIVPDVPVRTSEVASKKYCSQQLVSQDLDFGL
jgi:hypothetical protein